jgi:hypothetical protein
LSVENHFDLLVVCGCWKPEVRYVLVQALVLLGSNPKEEAPDRKFAVDAIEQFRDLRPFPDVLALKSRNPENSLRLHITEERF